MEQIQQKSKTTGSREKTQVERELNLLMEMTLRMEHELQMLDVDSEED